MPRPKKCPCAPRSGPCRRAAVEQAPLVLAVASTDREVVAAALAVLGAIGVKAAEAIEVGQSKTHGAGTGDNSYQVRGTGPENDSTLPGHDRFLHEGRYSSFLLPSGSV
jgi:hypothetical protein